MHNFVKFGIRVQHKCVTAFGRPKTFKFSSTELTRGLIADTVKVR